MHNRSFNTTTRMATPVMNMKTVERQFEESLVTERMIASLSTGFSLLATALSVSRDDSGNLYAKRVVLEITRAVSRAARWDIGSQECSQKNDGGTSGKRPRDLRRDVRNEGSRQSRAQ
jgi:hypothetical protein